MSEQELQQEFDDKVEELDEQLEQEVEEAQEEVVEESPKGYKSYDQYIEDGGDPDMFRGKKAYEQFYDKNQELKALKNDIKEVKLGVSQMAQAQQESHNQTVAKMMAKFEDDMQQAKDSLDFDAYEKADRARADLQKQNIAKAPEAERPFQSIISGFRSSNSMLDPSSPDYDQDLDQAVVNRVNAKASKMNINVLDESDIKSLLEDSLNDAKGKFAKYQSKTPKTPPKTRQAAKKVVQSAENTLSGLSEIQRSIYDTVKETSGDDAAKNYLKKVGA